MTRGIQVQRGFTLLELLSVIMIIGILITLAVPGYKQFLGKADRGNCQSNLRNLYAAASGYVNDHNQWPQIPSGAVSSPAYAQAWQAALRPYSISKVNWICPAVQRSLHSPDYEKIGHERLDYFAMPFDDKPQSPRKWPMQPWFLERGNVHGDGQLLILTSGEVRSLAEITKAKGFIYPGQ